MQEFEEALEGCAIIYRKRSKRIGLSDQKVSAHMRSHMLRWPLKTLI